MYPFVPDTINSPSDLTPSPTLIDATDLENQKSIFVKSFMPFVEWDVILKSFTSVPSSSNTGSKAVGPHS